VARTMRRNPVFAVPAVLVMALGIAGNTAMFTVIRAVLLKPLAYGEPEGLVRVSGGARSQAELSVFSLRHGYCVGSPVLKPSTSRA
jgi:hypothetical protein